MRRNGRKRRGADLEVNLTSLIDVTFLLIVFFVLVSRIHEVENVQLDLPRPSEPATVQPEAPRLVAVNVMPSPDGQARSYRVEGVDFAPDQSGLEALTNHLTDLYRTTPQLCVNLRADRATHFEQIDPVMQAIAAAARTVPENPDGSPRKARLNLIVQLEN